MTSKSVLYMATIGISYCSAASGHRLDKTIKSVLQNSSPVPVVEEACFDVDVHVPMLASNRKHVTCMHFLDVPI